MEVFKDTSFDFLGRKWAFLVPSLLLLAAGTGSLVVKGGPHYGIDFLGGAVMEAAWDGAPPVKRIRAAVSSRLAGAAVISARESTGSREVLISAELPAGNGLTEVRQRMEEALAEVGGKYTIRGFEVIGPQIGADLRRQALLATAGASGGMLLYLAWRFQAAYGAAAVIAMAHDAWITVGIFSLLDQEVSLPVVAALLTLIGYSMNDTIVVFDRIRENRREPGRKSLADIINRSINQTLSRTVLSSGLTLLTALALLIFGAAALRGFSLALVIGIMVGTLSSVFVASPILAAWEERRGGTPVSRPTWLRGGAR